MYNLLSNAVKYTPEHGTIAVSLRQNEGRFVISVKDSGPGISPEREREMFKPFMHGLASQGGMGIGLYTAHQMAYALKMGRTKFYGKVKEIMGVPPNKYIINERMRLAEELLRESDLNISEISYKVGIPDLSYFNRCFKAHFGMAPSKYRKEL